MASSNWCAATCGRCSQPAPQVSPSACTDVQPPGEPEQRCALPLLSLSLPRAEYQMRLGQNSGQKGGLGGSQHVGPVFKFVWCDTGLKRKENATSPACCYMQAQQHSFLWVVWPGPARLPALGSSLV